MGQKPRSDRKLTQLPMEQQEELCEMLLANMSYAAVRALVLEKWKVKTSTGALHDYYHDFCVPELARRRHAQKQAADSIVEEAKESPGKWTEAALEKLGQYALEMMMLPGADPKHVKSIFSMVFKKEDADFRREQLELEKEKFALQKKKAEERDKAGEVVGNERLTPEEKQARLKQIFGMG